MAVQDRMAGTGECFNGKQGAVSVPRAMLQLDQLAVNVVDVDSRALHGFNRKLPMCSKR